MQPMCSAMTIEPPARATGPEMEWTRCIIEHAMCGTGPAALFRFRRLIRVHHEQLRVRPLIALAVDATTIFTHGGTAPDAG
jgi:hypothetical protein